MSKEKQRLNEAMNDSWQRHREEGEEAMRQLEARLKYEFTDCIDDYTDFDPGTVEALSQPDWGLAREMARERMAAVSGLQDGQ